MKCATVNCDDKAERNFRGRKYCGRCWEYLEGMAQMKAHPKKKSAFGLFIGFLFTIGLFFAAIGACAKFVMDHADAMNKSLGYVSIVMFLLGIYFVGGLLKDALHGK